MHIQTRIHANFEKKAVISSGMFFYNGKVYKICQKKQLRSLKKKRSLLPYIFCVTFSLLLASQSTLEASAVVAKTS